MLLIWKLIWGTTGLTVCSACSSEKRNPFVGPWFRHWQKRVCPVSGVWVFAELDQTPYTPFFLLNWWLLEWSFTAHWGSQLRVRIGGSGDRLIIVDFLLAFRIRRSDDRLIVVHLLLVFSVGVRTTVVNGLSRGVGTGVMANGRAVAVQQFNLGGIG